MPDFTTIPILPQNIGAIETVKRSPEASLASAVPRAGEPSFKETLMKTLGQIQQDTEQVSQASPPSYEEMDQVMKVAQTAFTDTMQAHQLMQQLFNQSAMPQQEIFSPKGEK